MVFLLLVSVLFKKTLTFIVVGGVSGQGGIKMTSAKTQSANEPAKTTFWSTQYTVNDGVLRYTFALVV